MLPDLLPALSSQLSGVSDHPGPSRADLTLLPPLLETLTAFGMLIALPGGWCNLLTAVLFSMSITALLRLASSLVMRVSTYPQLLCLAWWWLGCTSLGCPIDPTHVSAGAHSCSSHIWCFTPPGSRLSCYRSKHGTGHGGFGLERHYIFLAWLKPKRRHG